MSANGLDAFDKTIQTTNIWLNEIMEQIGPDRQVAWKVLSTVLHKLRDRLNIGLAAHLGAELPLLVRGAYYDQFEPAKLPTDCDTREQFVTEAMVRGNARGADAGADHFRRFACFVRQPLGLTQFGPTGGTTGT